LFHLQWTQTGQNQQQVSTIGRYSHAAQKTERLCFTKGGAAIYAVQKGCSYAITMLHKMLPIKIGTAMLHKRIDTAMLPKRIGTAMLHKRLFSYAGQNVLHKKCG
jgi:hypothetical protein